MEVQFSLKDWKVIQDEKTKLPRLVGHFAVVMGEKEIATQSFNDGYGSKDIPFTGELINKIMCLENDIKNELTRMIG